MSRLVIKVGSNVLTRADGHPDVTNPSSIVDQIAALRSLLARLKKEYPTAKIYGHRDFAAKACPSFDAKTEYSDL